MKIAIIVHSNSGNTFSVAEEVQVKLRNIGHEVVIEKVVASNNQEVEVAKVELISKPPLEGYDAYVFAAPVHAFSLSGVMRAYLAQIIDLESKPVYYFLTMHFPFRWMGGNHASKQFSKALEKKKASIKGYSVINWGLEKKRTRQIIETVNLIDFN